MMIDHFIMFYNDGYVQIENASHSSVASIDGIMDTILEDIAVSILSPWLAATRYGVIIVTTFVYFDDPTFIWHVSHGAMIPYF